MSSSNAQAKTLRDAMRTLDPKKDLQTAKELHDYFLERENSPIEELIVHLSTSEEPQHILFTGQIGSGKSTELAQCRHLLDKEMPDQWLFVSFSIRTVANIEDLTHSDVLFSFALKLVEEAEQVAGKLSPKVVEIVNAYFTDMTREMDMKSGHASSVDLGLQAKAGIGIFSFIPNFIKRYTQEHTLRTQIRTKVEPRLSELYFVINELCKDIQTHTGKRVLGMIEDLDKTNLTIARKLFHDHASDLSTRALVASILYTFPIALRYDERRIETLFDRVCVLPNWTVHTRQGNPADGRKALKTLLLKRIDPKLFTSLALKKLLDQANGIPRELIRTTQIACAKAIVKKQDKINEDAVEAAFLNLRTELQPNLSMADKRKMKELSLNPNKQIDRNEEYGNLLQNLAILEYLNGRDLWYDVNPVLLPLLDYIRDEEN